MSLPHLHHFLRNTDLGTCEVNVAPFAAPQFAGPKRRQHQQPQRKLVLETGIHAVGRTQKCRNLLRLDDRETSSAMGPQSVTNIERGILLGCSNDHREFEDPAARPQGAVRRFGRALIFHSPKHGENVPRFQIRDRHSTEERKNVNLQHSPKLLRMTRRPLAPVSLKPLFRHEAKGVVVPENNVMLHALTLKARIDPTLDEILRLAPAYPRLNQTDFGEATEGKRLLLSGEAVLESPVLAAAR